MLNLKSAAVQTELIDVMPSGLEPAPKAGREQ